MSRVIFEFSGYSLCSYFHHNVTLVDVPDIFKFFLVGGRGKGGGVRGGGRGVGFN